MKKETKVEIEWIDSSCREGWRDTSDYQEWNKKHLFTRSLGYVWQDSKDVVVIVQSYTPDQIDNQLCIPKTAIKRIRKL